MCLGDPTGFGSNGYRRLTGSDVSSSTSSSTLYYSSKKHYMDILEAQEGVRNKIYYGSCWRGKGWD